MARKYLRFGSLVFLCSQIATAFAASPPVSSPEGTLTTYVQGKNSLIYPPRSARAQKVEFDTPDQQMIYERDTPFRAFFNSHSADFQSGKVDYAKTTILNDIISALRNKEYIRNMVKEVFEQDLEVINLPPVDPDSEPTPIPGVASNSNSDPSKGDKKTKQQQRFANLLIDGVTLILERENYPELRDEDIDGILARLTQNDPIESSDQLAKQIHEAWAKYVVKGRADQLRWELRQALCEKRNLKGIIADAVARRPDLFKGAGSPSGAMKDGLGKIDDFVRGIADNIDLADFTEGKKSLWSAFVSKLNNSSLLRRTNVTDKLGDDELAAFGKKWREDLTAAIEKGSSFDKAVRDSLAARRTNLVGKPYEAAVATKIVKALTNRQDILDAYVALSVEVPQLKAATDTVNTSQTAAQTTDAALATKRVEAEAAASKIKGARQDLKTARDNLNASFGSLKKNNVTLNAGVQAQLDKVRQAKPGNLTEIETASGQVSNAFVNFQKLSQLYASVDDDVGKALDSALADFQNSTKTDLEKRAVIDSIRTQISRLTQFAADTEAKLGDNISSSLNDLAAKVDANPSTSGGFDYQAAAKKLQDDWGSLTTSAASARESAVRKRTEAIATIKDSDTDKALKAYVDAALGKQSNADSLALAQSQLKTARANYDAAETKFLKSVVDGLQALQSAFPASQDFAGLQSEAKDRIGASLSGVRNGTGGIPTLEATLNGALSDLANDTSATEQVVLIRIQKTFAGATDLLKSDDPVLKAFLKSGKVSFANQDFAKKAVDQIPAKFAPLAPKATSTGGITADTIMTGIESALKDVDVTYLFGNGDATIKIIEAFKGEFYNAFKHRIPEALAAERDADYDYWWLSFYPKAVPVGANQFHGQSILEVGFNDNIVPVEQYHRWLEDQRLGNDNPERAFAHRSQLAAAVLNDFLAALDSNLLSDRFPGIREEIQKTIAILAQAIVYKGDAESFYERGMLRLIKAALAKQTENAEKIGKFDTNSAQPNAVQGGKSAKEEAATDPVLLYFKKAESVIDELDVQAEENLKALEDKARTGLAWSDLDIRHVAFAALAASVNNASLPEKVQLYCSAFWGGSRRFAETLSPADRASLYKVVPDTSSRRAMLSEKYVVPFEDAQELEALSRYLLLRGVSPKGVSLLQARYRQFLGKVTLPEKRSESPTTTKQTPLAQGNSDIVSGERLFEFLDNLTKGSSISVFPFSFCQLQQAAANREITLNDLQEAQKKIETEKQKLLMLEQQNASELRKIEKSFDEKDTVLSSNRVEAGKLISEKFQRRRAMLTNATAISERSRAELQILEQTLRVGEEEAELKRDSALRQITLRFDNEMIDLESKTNAVEKSKALQILKRERAAAEAAVAETFAKARLDREKQRLSEQARILNLRSGPTADPIDDLQAAETEERRKSLESSQRESQELSAAKTVAIAELSAKNQMMVASVKANIAKFEAGIKELQSKLDAPILQKSNGRDSNKCPEGYCPKLEEMMALLSNLSWDEQCELSRYFFANVDYATIQQPSRYLGYPVLWPLEQNLDRTRERLRSIVVHLYHSEYPSIPDPDRIRKDFLQRDADFKYLIYQWLRDLYVNLFDEQLLAPPKGARDDDELARRKQVKVLGTLLLDRNSFLTPDAKRELLRIFAGERSIYDWIEKITANQLIVDQLHRGLLESVYTPVFAALEYLNKVERQSVPYPTIRDKDFERFALYKKPRQQKGIQIVDLLPVSRDDLVSMSINEGGVVAKIAGQAEGAAAYDMNQMQTVLRNAQILSGQNSDISSGIIKGMAATNTLEDLSDNRSISRDKSLSDLSKIGQGANLSGYSLGATAQGSVYGRARAALAYSRRREYLDAVITSAGRGDNFAKWVIRPSDLRSELAQKVGKKFVAAAHNGFPNGDQPFYVLVKVPKNAIHTDWGGRRYIYFNSAYSATGRHSFWRDFGWPGLLVKAPFTIINHNMWSKMEETMVTAVFPFMWNVPTSDPSPPRDSKLIRVKSNPDPWYDRNEKDLLALGRTANPLGGEIQLDDTDKIRYSEIRSLLDAEADFIQLTRSAQLSDLNNTMDAVQKEFGTFRTNVLSGLKDRAKQISDVQQSQADTAKLKEKQEALEQKLQKLQDDLKALQQPKQP